MKKYKIIFLLPLVIISCKKNGNIANPISLSAFNIINATNGLSPVVANFSNEQIKYFNTSQQISYGSFYEYSVPSGNVPIKISQITDTTNSVFNGIINLKVATIYSLFLAGNISTHIDTLLTIDHPPYYTVNDSVAGIRFVNLSAGSNPISVNIQGNANGSEVNSLAYKGVSKFKAYTYTSTMPATADYNFEIRDTATGTLLTTFDYTNMFRFHNITVVFYGPTSSQGTFTVNNF